MKSRVCGHLRATAGRPRPPTRARAASSCPPPRTRPPLALVAAIALTVASGMLYHSSCITCEEMSSPRTGWNVPAPTCSVTRAEAIPFAASASSIARVEVQPRRRRGHRPRHRRVHRLVARLVLGVRRVRDVGRQRHLAVRGEDVEHARPRLEAKLEEVVPAPRHLRRHARRELEPPARLGRLARAHVRERRARARDPLDEHLHLPARVLAAAQPRLDDARVVEHEQVPRIDERGQVAEGEVAKRPARLHAQQPAGRALRRGMLGDEFRRQAVVEVGELHPAIIISSRRSTRRHDRWDAGLAAHRVRAGGRLRAHAGHRGREHVPPVRRDPPSRGGGLACAPRVRRAGRQRRRGRAAGAAGPGALPRQRAAAPRARRRAGPARPHAGRGKPAARARPDGRRGPAPRRARAGERPRRGAAALRRPAGGVSGQQPGRPRAARGRRTYARRTRGRRRSASCCRRTGTAGSRSRSPTRSMPSAFPISSRRSRGSSRCIVRRPSSCRRRCRPW